MASEQDDSPKSFDWKEAVSGILPELEKHSEAKLEILRDYLVEYILICFGTLPRGATDFKLYLVDGFAGGGVYNDGKLGSPLVMLKAIEEAEFRINQGRTNPVKIQVKYIFADDSKEAISCLTQVLTDLGYGSRIGQDIELIQGDFQQEQSQVCGKIRKSHPKGGARALFFLDQCGYSKVSPQMIQEISASLPKAEFIVNFAVTWLSDFMGDEESARKLLSSAGLEQELSIDDLIRQRKKEGQTSWSWTVESQISQAYQTLAQMPYFSPFYISPKDNHRGYWLLHLAPHPRARQAMMSVLWRRSNRVRHYGKAGLEILSYKAEEEGSLYQSGTMFDDFEKDDLVSRLQSELPEQIEEFTNGISFKELLAKICNQTNADIPILKDSLTQLHEDKLLIVEGKGGGKKSQNNFAIQNDDVIRLRRQKWLGL